MPLDLPQHNGPMQRLLWVANKLEEHDMTYNTKITYHLQSIGGFSNMRSWALQSWVNCRAQCNLQQHFCDSQLWIRQIGHHMLSWNHGGSIKRQPWESCTTAEQVVQHKFGPPEIANRWKKRRHPRIQSASIVASVKRPRSTPVTDWSWAWRWHRWRIVIQKKTHVHKTNAVLEFVLPVFNGSHTLQENQLCRISSASNHTSFLQRWSRLFLPGL